jgi:acyl-coenzyme A thioesterase PaaI-like protein
MSKSRPSPGAELRRAWAALAPLPGGKWLFSRFLGLINRYSGSTGARVEALEPGYAKVVLRDRAKVRNHVNSVHAVALTNVAELASGLAVLAGLPKSVRGIPIRIAIAFPKKARGRLVAECRCVVPAVTADVEQEFTSVVRDGTGDEVARATVTWRLGPVPVL